MAAAAVRMSANSTQSANRSPRVAEMPHAAAVRKGVSAFKGAAIVLALALACTLPSGVAANTPMESTSKALSSGAHIKHVDAKAQVNQIAWRRRGISHTRKLFNFPLPSRPMRRNPRPKPWYELKQIQSHPGYCCLVDIRLFCGAEGEDVVA